MLESPILSMYACTYIISTLTIIVINVRLGFNPQHPKHKEQIGINSSHRKSVMNKRQRRRQNVCQNINNNTLNNEIAGCEMDSPYDNRIVVALVPGDTVQSICGDTAVGYYTNDPIVECLNEITATPLSRKRSHKLKYRQRRIENNKRRKEYDGDQ